MDDTGDREGFTASNFVALRAAAARWPRAPRCRRLSAAVVAAFALALGASPAAAVKVPLGLPDDDLQLNIGLLVQPQGVLSSATNNGVGSVDTEFYLRRARILLAGTILGRISFFFDTDIPKWGEGGKFDQPFYVQDAMIMGEYFHDQFIDAGFILVPFSHLSLQGATSLLSVDYATTLVRPPNNVGKAWRDDGVELRGYVVDRRIQYRIGAFSGITQGTAGPVPMGSTTPSFILNPNGIPRFAGHVRVNILGRENDFFLKGIYFADHPMLSIGGGWDYQHSALAGVSSAQDYLAASGDIFADIPFGSDLELTLQGVYDHHSQGDALPENNGDGFIFEGGFRYKWISVVTLEEYFHSADGRHDSVIAHGGLNWWIRRHNANVKLDFGWKRTGNLGSAPDIYTGTLQGQVYF